MHVLSKDDYANFLCDLVSNMEAVDAQSYQNIHGRSLLAFARVPIAETTVSLDAFLAKKITQRKNFSWQIAHNYCTICACRLFSVFIT